MDIGVEISLYPLHQQFIPPIQDFIDRLNTDGALRIVTNSMSTQVFGEYRCGHAPAGARAAHHLRANDKAVFVMKVLGPLSDVIEALLRGLYVTSVPEAAGGSARA